MRAVAAAFRGIKGGTRTLSCLILCGALALGVAAPAGAQSSPYNSLTLSWIAPGDDGDVGQVNSYQLHYSTTPVGSDTTSWWNDPAAQRITLGPPLASAGATDSRSVTGLTPGTTYYFILRALDEWANISGFSNVAVGTTQSCNAPTTIPGQFDAVPDTGQVVVSWSATGDPKAATLDLYRAVGTSGTWALLRNLPIGGSPYTDTAVSPGTTYRYRAAWMGAICEGPVTSTVQVTTPGIPPPPTAADAGHSTIHVYPNPASTSVRLEVDNAGSTSQSVLVRLFDMNGHWIATLADGTVQPGSNQISWARLGRDGKRVPPGYYEVLGNVGSSKVRERLVLLP
jgi:hypothetical protein